MRAPYNETGSERGQTGTERGSRTRSKLDILIAEVEQVPEPLLDEVLDFVRFLKAQRALEQRELALASEPVLSRDWLTPEEDAAWQDL